MLLRHRSTFRRLWTAQFVSAIGDGMRGIALLWWAAGHGGADALVVVGVAGTVPIILGSPLGGRLADRWDRRRLLVVADLARLATSAVLAALLLGAAAEVWHVATLAAVAALAGAVFDPTYAAAVPSVVADDDLPAANGLNMANGAVGNLLGPLAGGLLIAAFDVGVVLAIDALTFAWSVALLSGCRLPRPALANASGDSTESDAGLITRLRSVPGLTALVTLAMTLNMIVGPLPIVLASFATEELDASPTLFGILPTLLGLGLLAGSLLAPLLARGPLAIPFVALGACLASIGLVPLPGVFIALALSGVAIAAANAGAMTILQRSIPADIQGQAFGLLGSLGEALRPAGVALGAPLLAAFGADGSFVAIGLAVAIASLASVLGRLPSGRVSGESDPGFARN